jgi:predicted CXXCH cytochrome family protein
MPEVHKMVNPHKSIKNLRNMLLAILFAVIVGLVLVVSDAMASGSDAAMQTTATPSPGHELTPGGDDTQKKCAECHLDIAAAWSGSSHAHAYDDQVFLDRWNSLGKPGECLACHTTNYQSTTNSFAAEGVQCEACHGESVEGHPPAVVPIKADTEYCGTCHTTTLGEWRLTGHSTAGVGCMDCHDPHSQKPLFENPDDMCLNCHKDEMGEYLEDLHIKQGIGCVDCHALVIPPDPVPDDGIVPTGHAFTITTSTCVACHTDSLHAGFALPGYENGARAAIEGQPESGEAQPTEQVPVDETHESGGLTAEQQVQALEASLASSRFSSLFQGGIIGLVLGGLTIYYVGRNGRKRSADEHVDQSDDVHSAADGEVVDQELEKILVLIERGLEGVINAFRKANHWIRTRFTRKSY